jgi:hypothetical protein
MRCLEKPPQVILLSWAHPVWCPHAHYCSAVDAVDMRCCFTEHLEGAPSKIVTESRSHDHSHIVTFTGINTCALYNWMCSADGMVGCLTQHHHKHK